MQAQTWAETESIERFAERVLGSGSNFRIWIQLNWILDCGIRIRLNTWLWDSIEYLAFGSRRDWKLVFRIGARLNAWLWDQGATQHWAVGSGCDSILGFELRIKDSLQHNNICLHINWHRRHPPSYTQCKSFTTRLYWFWYVLMMTQWINCDTIASYDPLLASNDLIIFQNPFETIIICEFFACRHFLHLTRWRFLLGQKQLN